MIISDASSQLAGRWAMVTGASRGIGREVAMGLGQIGCNLVLHSRSVDHTRELEAVIRAMGVETLSVAADLAVPEQVDELVMAVSGHGISIDILYNNAGYMCPWQEDVWHIPSDYFRKSFEINVLSQIRLCAAFLPAMIGNGWGRVINLTSGIKDQPQLSPYAISKAALRKYVEDLAPYMADSGVYINSLDPGWLSTDMGGPDAPNRVDSVLPGALLPVLLKHPVSGYEFLAQDYAALTLEQAISGAEEKISAWSHT